MLEAVEYRFRKYCPLFVVALDVNVLASTIDVPRVEVYRGEPGVLLQQVPACKNAQSDVLSNRVRSGESNRN